MACRTEAGSPTMGSVTVVEVPLAARRACRTCFDGAMSVGDAEIDARTGANIRGSSMAAVVVCRAAAVLETFPCSVGAAFSAFVLASRLSIDWHLVSNT